MHVLIVDDDLANRELLRAMVESQEHTVSEAGDGLEALAVLEKEKIEAVISDILMPRMDGYRLCLELRKREKLKAIPFIFYTSTYTLPSDEKAGLNVGADKFLRKPAAVQQVMQALQDAAANRARQCETFNPVPELEVIKECNQRLVEKLEEKHRKLELETRVLQTTQERLHHVLSFSQAVIYSLKPQSQGFNLAWMSDNVAQLLGYSLEETSQPDWWSQNLHSADREQVNAARLRLLSEGRAALEYRFRRKDGEFRWLRDEQRVVWGAQGQPLEIIGTAMDITEFRDLQELLRQSQKMEAIGRLAGGVAHDFNNLLAVIRGNVELGLMDRELGPETSQCLKQAEAAVERAAGLTRQLLAFGRRQFMQPQVLDLNDVIAHVAKMLERIIGTNVQLSCCYASPSPVVRADAGMLEQVIVNLVVNARDAMPNGGKVLISTESVRLDRDYVKAHPESRAGEFVALTVSDNGMGIASEHLPRIFEPFFSTKEMGKGTGLGLATVYGIVKQHQGWIEVSSQLKGGSTFRILLPAKKPEPAGTPSPEAHPASPRGGSETILLVEDEEAVRSSLRRLLEKFGYQVQEAASGRAAIQDWGNRLEEIDLVLTDMIMPEGVNGHQLAQALLAQKEDLRIIFMSGYTGPVRAEETGFMLRNHAQLLHKPCSSQQLLQTVRECLDRPRSPRPAPVTVGG